MKKLNRSSKKKMRSSLRVETLEQRQLLAGILGGGTEVGSNIVHANGNVYDQVLMTGSAVSVTADAGQITRVSFLDLSGDIVQVEFSGAGLLNVSLDSDSFKGAAEATNYNQPGVKYVTGLASFTILGSDASTNFSVFTVGSATAHNGLNNPIFAGDKLGGNNLADIQRLTIVADPANANGSAFGGIRAGNAVFAGSSGVAGISAANVAVQNVVVIGDIYATGSATPSLNFGANSQFGSVTVAGGDLVNANRISNPGYAYNVVLNAGTTSGGATLPAQDTLGQLSFTNSTPASVASATSRSFDLTANADSGANYTGGAAADTFNATGATLTAGDSLVGGGGVDTLSVTYTGSAATIGASVSTSGIEAAKFTNVGSGLLTVEAALMSGITDVYALGGTQAVTVQNTDTIPNIHISSNTGAVIVAPTAKAVEGTADATTVALSAATGSLTYNSVETLNVVTSGTATGTTSARFTFTDNALKAMTVSGSAPLVANVAFADQAAQGSVSFTAADATAGVNINFTALGNTAANVGVSLTGSAQGDTFSVASSALKRNETVVGGATANTVALATIAGGAGSDTLVLTGDLSATSTAGQAQLGANITGFETLKTASSINLSAIPNNSFTAAELTAGGTLTMAGAALNDVLISGDGTVVYDRASDTTSNSGLVLTLNGTANLTVASLTAADEETLTLVSSGGTAVTVNTITTLSLADATSLTIQGSKALTITNAITNTTLATINAGAHTGSTLSINASNATVATTVTGSAGAEATVGATVNTITTGSGNDSVTGGAYKDVITTGLGNDTVIAGAGNDTVTTDLGNDSIMGGDGNDSIDAGAGNDYIDGEAGDDTIQASTGLDTVKGGAGNDTIYVTSLQAGDDIDGGTGTDVLSLSALRADSLGGAQASEYVNVGDSVAAKIAGVETAYIEVTTTTLNTSSASALDLDLSLVTGLNTLWLDVVDTDANANEFVKVTNFSGGTINLSDTSPVSGLTLDGTGQSSLTTNLRGVEGGTITYTGVEAVTVNGVSLTSNTTPTGLTNTVGAVSAATASAITISTSPGNATTSGTTTVASVSAPVASTVALNVGSYSTLNVTGDVLATTGLESGFAQGGLDIDLGTNSVLNVDGGDISFKSDGSITSLTVDLAAGSTLADLNGAGADTTVNVSADKTASAAIVVTSGVNAASHLMLDLNLGITSGTVTLTSAFSGESAWTVDTIGKAGQTTSLTITGTGDVDASSAGSIVLSGTSVSFNASGLTDNDGLSVTADAVTVASTISGSSGDDVIVGSDGADVLTGGAGDDVITGGAGADTITGGTGADIIVIGATDSGITVATADRVVGFVTNEDNLSLGAAGDDVGGASTDETYTEAGSAVADFAAALIAANAALLAMDATEGTATKFYNLQWDATNGYLFIDSDADGDADMVVVLPGITGATFGPDDIDP